MTESMGRELIPKYDGHKSFYGKAKTYYNDHGDTMLRSYGTTVAKITREDGKRCAIVYGTYGATTLRHIKEFLTQGGFEASSKSQLIRDYMVGGKS
jgi:hypothetical protein